MNERINAYLKQHHCRDYFNSYGETVEDDHYFMYQEDVDGLIELIVRECAERLLNDAKLTDIQTTRCVASIREHFGVGE